MSCSNKRWVTISEWRWCQIASRLSFANTWSWSCSCFCARCIEEWVAFDWRTWFWDRLRKNSWRTWNVFVCVIFSRSISRSDDVASLLKFSDRWCRDLNADYCEKIKEQITWYSRWERIAEEWSDYLIDDEIVRVDVSDLLTNFTTCAIEKVLQNDRDDLKKKDSHWRTMWSSQWTTMTKMFRKC